MAQEGSTEGAGLRHQQGLGTCPAPSHGSSHSHTRDRGVCSDPVPQGSQQRLLPNHTAQKEAEPGLTLDRTRVAAPSQGREGPRVKSEHPAAAPAPKMALLPALPTHLPPASLQSPPCSTAIHSCHHFLRIRSSLTCAPSSHPTTATPYPSPSPTLLRNPRLPAPTDCLRLHPPSPLSTQTWENSNLREGLAGVLWRPHLPIPLSVKEVGAPAWKKRGRFGV